MNAPIHCVDTYSPQNGFVGEVEGSAERSGPEACSIGALVVLDQFNRVLAEAKTLHQITNVRNRAEAVRNWIKSAAMGLEMQNRAAELKLRAERKAGQLLSDLNLRGGDRKSHNGADRLKLADLGISQNQSKRWQKEAAIPEDDFQLYLHSTTQLGEEVTTAGLLRLSRRVNPATASQIRPDSRRPRASREPSPVGSGSRNGKGRNFAEQLDVGSSEVLKLVREIKDHHTLLISLLEPLYEGRQVSLLPGQCKGIRHYMSEVARLLAQLIPDAEAERKQSSAVKRRAHP